MRHQSAEADEAMVRRDGGGGGGAGRDDGPGSGGTVAGRDEPGRECEQAGDREAKLRRAQTIAALTVRFDRAVSGLITEVATATAGLEAKKGN